MNPDVIALMTVENTDLDYDKVRFLFNGEVLNRNKTLADYQIRDDYTVVVDLENNAGRWWCLIF